MNEIVPEGWRLQPLSALAEYHNGRAFKPEDWTKDGLPIVRIAQINNPFQETDHYRGSDILDRHLITKGDLIFSWSATLKAILWGGYDAVLNQHIFKVIEKPSTSRLYLQQLLEYSIERLSQSSHGSTMKHIKKGVLDEFHSPIPPLPEQKKIASILTSVDEVIEKTQSQIDKLQDLKKGTMNELLTKGIGHTEFKDSELGMIPKSWEVKTLLSLALGGISNGVFNDPQKQGTGYRLINVVDMYQEFGFEGEALKRLELSEPEFKKNRVRWGDILFTRSSLVLEGIAHCNVCLIDADDITYDGHIMKVSPDTSVIEPIFFAMHCLSNFGRTFFMRSAKQTTMTTIGQQDIAPLLIPVPPIEEQKCIVRIHQNFEQRDRDVRNKLKQLQSLKRSLMQDLLTGKVRVLVS